jgi:hypothetical protein
MGLKEDAKFARYITMGALGAKHVASDLTQHGHLIVELERYAMANKIWTTKVKRLRMADLVCLRCGRRFEAKAKSNLEVKLSDSTRPGRGWAHGMRANDVFAFLRVVVDQNAIPTEIGEPIYFTTSSLKAVPPSKGQAKSAADGAERDVFWPITLAKQDGVVEKVENGKVKIRWHGGRPSYLGRPGNFALPQVGDLVAAGEVISASVAPQANLSCHGDSWDLELALASDDEVELFAAVKAAGLLEHFHLREHIEAIASDNNADLRLRVEAWGALARLGSTSAVASLADLRASQDDEAMQLERVLVLSELTDSTVAGDILKSIVCDPSLSGEIRAAAVWGLGSSWHDRFTDVWDFVDDSDLKVRRHAQASLGEPGESDVARLVTDLAHHSRAPLAAAVLAVSKEVGPLLETASDPERSDWAIQALGQLPVASVDGLDREQAAAVRALRIRNGLDTHNEPTNLTELQFLAGQNLHAPRAGYVPFDMK